MLSTATHCNIERHDTRLARTNRISRYQNVSIPDFIGAKDEGGGGDNCSYKTCEAPVK